MWADVRGWRTCKEALLIGDGLDKGGMESSGVGDEGWARGGDLGFVVGLARCV